MTKSIAENPIPLILKNILKEKISGELTITLTQHSKKLFFSQGILKFAQSNIKQERLGEILLKIGKINQTQFWNIHKLLEGETDKIGKILVQKNIITQKDVFFGLVSQFRIIALSLFELESGQWEFQEKIPDVPGDLSFNIELPSIIVEGMNKVNNLSFYTNKFKSFSPYVINLHPNHKDMLTAEDMNILQILSDHKNTSSEKLMTHLKISEDIFWRKMIILYLLDIIDFKDIQIEKTIDKNVEELLKYYDKIRSKKTDYYELLGIKNSGQVNEIKEAYFSLAKKFHPDRINNSVSSEIKEKANFVFATINKAYDTLSNENRKEEYDSKGYKESDQEDSKQVNLKEKARILFLKAKTLYNKKQYWEAASLLDEAVKIDNNKPAYILLLGLSQMNTDTLRRMAEKNLQKAIELEPWNCEPLIAMGKLFLYEGLKKRAETFFRKALSINPENEIAKKKLGEINKSSSKRLSIGSIFGKKKN